MTTIDTFIQFKTPFAVVRTEEFPENFKDALFIEFDPQYEGQSRIAIPVRAVMVSTSEYRDNQFLTKVFRVLGDNIKTKEDAVRGMDMTDPHLYEVGSIDKACNVKDAELNNFRLALQILQSRAMYDPRVVYFGER